MHLKSNSNHNDLSGNISFTKYQSDSFKDPTNSFHVTEMIFEILDGGRFVSGCGLEQLVIHIINRKLKYFNSRNSLLQTLIR